MEIRSLWIVLFCSAQALGQVGGSGSEIPDPKTESTVRTDSPETSEDPPEEVVLLLRNGREVTGLLEQDAENEIVLRIEGIETVFPKSDIRSMRVLAPLLERYAQMRSMVADDDLNGRVLLAEWLRSHEQYDLALEEVDAILKIDPMHPKAKLLHGWLVNQVELQAEKVDRPESPEQVASAKDRFAQRVASKRAFPLLKPEEINTIRVYEVDLEHPPRMVISRETIDQLIREHAESPLIPATDEGREALYKQRPEEILRLMFRLQARNLYPQVKVLDHPRAIRQFRTDVHGKWLINTCATAQCHGGTSAGRLWLYNDRPHSDETVYTNLFILDQFLLEDGTPLINYTQPAKSPLLQMGLPRDKSLYPHPEAPRTRGSRGWKPVFRTTSDRRFREAVSWISAMYRPRPKYPIEYTPPHPKPEAEEQEPDR